MTTLADMGVDTNLVAKLKPYIGLVDQKAVDLLKSNPLILTQPEMDALTEKIKSFAKKIFSKLPPAIQTSPRVKNLFKKLNFQNEFKKIQKLFQVVFLKGLEEKNDWVDLLVEVDKTRAELRRLLENPKQKFQQRFQFLI